jgi:hypothetical protein
MAAIWNCPSHWGNTRQQSDGQWFETAWDNTSQETFNKGPRIAACQMIRRKQKMMSPVRRWSYCDIIQNIEQANIKWQKVLARVNTDVFWKTDNWVEVFWYAGSFYIRVNAVVTNPLTHFSALTTNIACVCYRYEERRTWSEGLEFGNSVVMVRTQKHKHKFSCINSHIKTHTNTNTAT